MAPPKPSKPSEPFARDVISQSITLARKVMRQTPNRLEAVLELVRGRRAAIDHIGSQGHATECAASCFACCHQLVVTDPAEVILLALYLHHNRDAEARAALQRKAAHVARLPADPIKRFGPEAACPLLDDGRCTIYSARPLPCRMTYSAERMACVRALIAATDGQTAPPPWFAPAGEYAYLMQVGFDHVLNADYGLRVEKIDLARGLALALEDAPTIAAAWLGGEAPLRAAEVEIGPTDHQTLVRKTIRKLKLA